MRACPAGPSARPPNSGTLRRSPRVTPPPANWDERRAGCVAAQGRRLGLAESITLCEGPTVGTRGSSGYRGGSGAGERATKKWPRMHLRSFHDVPQALALLVQHGAHIRRISARFAQSLTRCVAIIPSLAHFDAWWVVFVRMSVCLCTCVHLLHMAMASGVPRKAPVCEMIRLTEKATDAPSKARRRRARADPGAGGSNRPALEARAQRRGRPEGPAARRDAGEALQRFPFSGRCARTSRRTTGLGCPAGAQSAPATCAGHARPRCRVARAAAQPARWPPHAHRRGAPTPQPAPMRRRSARRLIGDPVEGARWTLVQATLQQPVMRRGAKRVRLSDLSLGRSASEKVGEQSR